jgi:hypothetical protein
MRSTFAPIGTLALALALASCGGGGSSNTPPASLPAPLPSASAIPAVNNVNGPTAPMTVSIKIPARSAASTSAARAAFAKYSKTPAFANARTMANTSPSASIRAAGKSLASQRRGPAYVSPDTYNMELVLTSGGSVAFDQFVYCGVSANTCTYTFTAPIGTNYVALLYLYDYNGGLLSAGETSGVTVAATGPNNVSITLNGLANYFDVEAVGANEFYQDASGAQSFAITVAPYDYDGYLITTPGTIMDNTFTAITSFSLTPTTLDINGFPIGDTDVTPTGSTSVAVNGTLGASQTYNFGGTGPEASIYWTAQPVTSGPALLTDSGSQYYVPTTSSNTTNTFTDYPVTLSWTNNPNNYSGFTVGPPAIVEIPTSTTANYGFGLSEIENGNAVPFAGNISFTLTGCAQAITTAPATASYSSLQSNVQLQLAPTIASSTCVVTATDNAASPRSATLGVQVDQSTLTIQSKARNH